ncbi:MAG: phosphoenolpyruvate carboxykinase (ATP) [Candidatus Izemoplasmataceae bacterium]
MSSRHALPRPTIGSKTPRLFNRFRSTVETAFYRNNVIPVHTLEEAYRLARQSEGTIETDLPVYKAESLGLPEDAKVLLFNDGAITGRQAKARRIITEETMDRYASLTREGIFQGRKKTMYKASVIIGLDEAFSVKAHLLVPEGYENTLYSWMLNFQPLTDQFKAMYKDSIPYEEGDIFIYADPDYLVDGFEEGISIFDSEHNALALFGMRYFGEFKKGTLTLAWSIAERQGFTPCHGGMKTMKRKGGAFVMGVFGLSGSGKSTITHATHGSESAPDVLHDDAFVIRNKDRISVSMEPSYFDKVQDYPTDSKDNRFLLTLQNTGATLDEDGLIVPVNEDIRNGNGRAIKSQFWTPKRHFVFKEPLNAIFWIMKDDSLPPVLKLEDPVLSSTFGATLATKRTSAEYGVKQGELTFEPYANPFRLYPLRSDYHHFKALFETHSVSCYILNTGVFESRDIDKATTLGAIERIADDTAVFEPFLGLPGIKRMKVQGFDDLAPEPSKVRERLEKRRAYIENLDANNALPEETTEALGHLIETIKGASK